MAEAQRPESGPGVCPQRKRLGYFGSELQCKSHKLQELMIGVFYVTAWSIIDSGRGGEGEVGEKGEGEEGGGGTDRKRGGEVVVVVE